MHKFRRGWCNVEISTGSFVHMEENITTTSFKIYKIKKLQNEITTKLQVASITLIASVSQGETKMRKKEMENDNVVMYYLEEEGM